jgi:ketopantoate reductase
MSALGFIGLGAMGSRIAGRLLEAGHRVYGSNRTAAKAQPLIERGLLWRDTPREVAAAANVIFQHGHRRCSARRDHRRARQDPRRAGAGEGVRQHEHR